jgi:hypothetical protein
MSRLPHRLEERNHRSPSSVARNIRTRKQLTTAAAISAVRVELVGSNCATALGVEAHGPSPVLALCRALVEAGHDPTTPLHAYRGSQTYRMASANKTILNFAAAAAKRAARIAVTIGQNRRQPWPMSFSTTISTRLPKPISI